MWGLKSLVKELARQLSLDADGRQKNHRQQQQQEQQQQQPGGRQQGDGRQQCGAAPPPPSSQHERHRHAKAEAKAAAAGQPRPKGPSGPCGRPCAPPAGGAAHALPLASALCKRRPPWNATTAADPRLAHLLQGPGGEEALRVLYPAGSGPPSRGLRGGLQLRGFPPCLPATDAVLQFQFCTAPDMDWTRGGKLGGGLHIGSGDAAGYLHSASAASARLVWGPNGSLMLYVYTMEGTQQDPAYASVARLGAGYGDHLFPGTFRVERGVWNSVAIRVRLNTPGRADGVAGLGINGQYREYDKMVWRLSGDTPITQVLLSTFFGGSWATPLDTHIDFAGFSLTILER